MCTVKLFYKRRIYILRLKMSQNLMTYIRSQKISIGKDLLYALDEINLEINFKIH